MKRIFFIALILCSCTNQKEKLEKQQKQTIDFMKEVQGTINAEMLSRFYKMKDSFSKAHPEWDKESTLKNAIMQDTIAYFGTDEMQEWVKMYNALSKRNDSIEVELNKIDP